MNKSDSFQEKLSKIHNNKFTILSNYVNCDTKIHVKCNVCKYDWWTKPKTMVRTKNPTGCPNCSHHVKITTESFKKYVNDTTNGEYILLGTYEKENIKTEIYHNKCKKSYLVRPNDFQQGYRCPYCSHPHSKKSNEEFINEVFNLVGNEYTVLSIYDGCNKKVLFEHEICKNKFYMKPTNFLSNSCRCPFCMDRSNSKPIKFIKSILDKKNMEYISECKLDQLKYKRQLKIDLYIPSINLYIEYDGEQHFNHAMLFQSDYEFNEYRKRDATKNNFFKENNLSLLRLDNSNYRKFTYILNNIMNERSTINEKYNLYYIENGKLIYDNKKYLVE